MSNNSKSQQKAQAQRNSYEGRQQPKQRGSEVRTNSAERVTTGGRYAQQNRRPPYTEEPKDKRAPMPKRDQSRRRRKKRVKSKEPMFQLKANKWLFVLSLLILALSFIFAPEFAMMGAFMCWIVRAICIVTVPLAFVADRANCTVIEFIRSLVDLFLDAFYYDDDYEVVEEDDTDYDEYYDEESADSNRWFSPAPDLKDDFVEEEEYEEAPQIVDSEVVHKPNSKLEDIPTDELMRILQERGVVNPQVHVAEPIEQEAPVVSTPPVKPRGGKKNVDGKKP